MSHVRDPIESALADLVYLRARIEAIERLASKTDHTQMRCDAVLEAVTIECRYLLATVAQIRQTLDPDSAK